MPRGRPVRKRLRRLVTALVAALAVPVGMTAAGGGTAAHAADLQCSVAYTANDWGSGFTANTTITNLGASAINGWTLTYAYSGNQTLQSGWNGDWSQSGQNVTVKSLDWNQTIAASGGNVTASANFNYTGTNTAPTAFTVNGTVCGGAHQPPLPVLTSPAAGTTYTAGADIPLAASAVAADNATVTKVEFYSDTTLLGSDTTAPYTVDWASVPAGDYSVYAKAYDSLGATGESTPVGIHVTAGPSIVATPAQLSVQQGKSGTYAVKLSSAPTANVTVAVARSAGNTSLSVQSGASLTFTPSQLEHGAERHGRGRGHRFGRGDLHRHGHRLPQGGRDGHRDRRHQRLRRALPVAVRQDHRPGERLLLAAGHPVPLGGDADRRGPGLRSRDHLRGVLVHDLAPGDVRAGHPGLEQVQRGLGDHGEVHDPPARRPAHEQLLQRERPGHLRAGARPALASTRPYWTSPCRWARTRSRAS